MPIKALDTTIILLPETSGSPSPVHDLVPAGFGAVFKYLRLDRANTTEIAHLRANGIKVGWVYEKGNPQVQSYFTTTQATTDLALATEYARALGVRAANANDPPGEVIFIAIDCDADPEAILPYFQTFHNGLKALGFRVGVYGSGIVCETFKAEGYAEFTWLSESAGWTGYQDWKDQADVLQELGECPFGGDLDTVVNAEVVS